ncbi:purple acid phosphatase family protein [Pseudohongiella spirulinae]|uniref:Metallophosphoesterase n=1 Tax=Pseudohongiella spirulinae TaxID=1249552 RepID=A0A0S2KFW2_9GAMM|nr:metallophosphoesterase family protein [Pseudohongiella spirulinae]ALO47011.1 Metallophosphoesterase [Pseudohongiella spirulinae]
MKQLQSNNEYKTPFYVGLLILVSLCFSPVVVAQNTLVPPGEVRYAPTAFPDRIILTATVDPAHNQTVSWRTRDSVNQAYAQISPATDTPALHLTSKQIEGNTVALKAGNGTAHHHNVTFTDLEPDTLYAYRVRGDGTWSEWFQFRTAKAGFEPHTAIYFGDAQNAVKAHFSRVIREAFSTAPRAQVMVHAGDLVNSSRDANHDDEWGEWFDAGSFINSMLVNFAAAGNHEYLSQESGPRLLVPQWPVHLTSPKNGPAALRSTVYYMDYQGVRYIALDSQQALQDDDMMAAQVSWLRQVLSNNPNSWTVVTYHHPMFSVSLGRDNPKLREHWQPVFDEFNVDLVLQGHDHTYGRGENVPSGASGQLNSTGPMYVVSVSGPKMYMIGESAPEIMDRLAEDTQLFQVIHFESDRIVYEARTATGELYDAFDIERLADNSKRLVDRRPDTPTRLCSNPEERTGSSCWGGNSHIELEHSH